VRATTPTSQPAGGEYALRAPGGGELVSRLARHFDVVVVLLAAIPVLLLGGPALGYLVGGGAWVAQSVLAHADRRWLDRMPFGASLFEAFGRIWLLAGAIVIAGVAGGRPDGLTAAVTIFVAYSIAFAVRVLSGRPEAPVQR
jgi:hypothetical protein